MDDLRIVAGERVPLEVPCCRCQATGHGWDRVMGKPLCPDCEENLIVGEGEPLVERVEKNRCAVCGCVGTLRYTTLPLNARNWVELDLCARHFRDLLARNLEPRSFLQLRRKLGCVGFNAGQIFLLHEAFYDEDGRSLQPAVEPEEPLV